MTRASTLCRFATIAVISLCGGWAVPRASAQQGGNAQGDAVREGKTAGEIRDVKSLQMPLVWIPAGTFVMGSPKNEGRRNFNEDQVRVTISKGFWMGQTEVTRAQWKQVMGTTPWKGREEKEGDDYPATWVGADDAIAFCRRLTTEERRATRLPDKWEFDLPTEAQWEYACRAGTTSRYSFGDDANQLGPYAWYDTNTGKVDEFYAHRVKQKRANPWNLFDMHGNVLEWCRDSYTEKLPGGTDPIVQEPGKLQTFKGGCWVSGTTQCRSAWRNGVRRTDSSSDMGFRVALAQKLSPGGSRGPNPTAATSVTVPSDAKAPPPNPALEEPVTMLVFQLRIPKAQDFSPRTDIQFVTESGAGGGELRYLKAKTDGNYRVFEHEELIFEVVRPRRAIMVAPPPKAGEKLTNRGGVMENITTQVFRLSIPAVPVPSDWSKWQKPDCVEHGPASWNLIYNQKPLNQSTKIPPGAFELRYKVEKKVL